MKKLISAIGLALLSLLMVAGVVLAISAPDSISFGTRNNYRVFENVAETGDMLFLAEVYPYYAAEPTDYRANEAFIFEILDTDNTTVLYSRSINEYGDRPESIYLSATQVTADGITSGAAYSLRLTGNPLVFPAITANNTKLVTLTGADYDPSLGANSTNPMKNTLRNFCITMAEDIEDTDAPTDPYVQSIQGYKYLTNDGAGIFIEGIPNLYNFCPILFQYGVKVAESGEPESTGAYAATITPLGRWGQTTADGLTNIGLFLGINQALAGSVVLMLLAVLLGIYIYSKTQSGIAVLIIVATAPIIGGYLALMPMALAFVFVIVIVMLMGYYFFSRGAL